jgi:hypothetical protein
VSSLFFLLRDAALAAGFALISTSLHRLRRDALKRFHGGPFYLDSGMGISLFHAVGDWLVFSHCGLLISD